LIPGRPVEVRGPVHLVPGENQGRFPRCHAVLIQGRETVLIDPGCGPGALGRLGDRAGLVLCSHTHPDHTAQAHLCTAGEMWVPAKALATAGRMDRLGPRFGGPALAGHWQSFVTRAMNFKEYRPTGSFSPGQEIGLGGLTLVCLPTPGHTADHYCFHLPELKLVIAADLDLTPFGPWYGHAESDLGRLRASISALAGLGAEVLVSGHQPPVTGDIPGRLAAWEAKIDQREHQLLAFLDQPRTMEEIVDAALIYRAHQRIPELLRYWEGQMQDRHLSELMAAGKVRQEGSAYLAV